MLNRLFALLLITAVTVAGCSQPTEEPAEAPEANAPAEESESASAAPESPEASEEEAAESEEVEAAPAEEMETAEAAEEEPAAVPIPDVLADYVIVSDDFTVTGVETLNADQLQYKLTASTKLNVDKVQNFFIEIYSDLGWTEDMNMSQKGNTVTSYKTPEGDFLVFIEADKGGRGSEVSINTGKV